LGQFSDREFRNVLGHFPTGVVVATAVHVGAPAGFAAQSFTSLSLDPPLVALCPARTSTSWPVLRAAGRFCINILAEDQREVCQVFATTGIDKFAELEWRPSLATGSPVITGALAYIDCDLEAEHDAGDHTIAVGRVRHIEVNADGRGPLLFYRGSYGAFAAARP
jgi:flavin reductase (DIM6/NTAB) family NADH-FMN oxidoreductase RutF